MKNVKNIVCDWLPPPFTRLTRRILGRGIHFAGEFSSWEEAKQKCTGYDAEGILEKVLAATLKVKHGDAAFERDSVLFEQIEYDWPLLTGLMWTAARNNGCLNVLDFGGSLGSSYFQNQKFLQSLRNVCWSVVEQAHYVEAGQKYIQDKQLRFYKTIDECLVHCQPNVILLSSVLQYLAHPTGVLRSLLNIGADVIILDRTIVNNSEEDKIYIQHVPSSIYIASYPCRSLSKTLLFSEVKKSFQLASEFSSLFFPALKSIKSEFKGYIFERNDTV